MSEANETTNTTRTTIFSNVANYETGTVTCKHLETDETFDYTVPNFDKDAIESKAALYGAYVKITRAGAKSAGETATARWDGMKTQASNLAAGIWNAKTRSTPLTKAIKDLEKAKGREATEEEIALLENLFG